MMKYKVIVRPDGAVEYECDNMADAIEFARRASTNGAQAPTTDRQGPGRPRNRGRVENSKSKAETSSTLVLLTALAEANSSGLTSEDVVRVLNLAGSRGVGGALIKVRRVLRELEMKKNDAFRSVGHPGKGRWRSGPRIVEAIEALKHKGRSGKP